MSRMHLKTIMLYRRRQTEKKPVLPHFYEVNKSNHGDRYKEKDSFGVLRVVKQSMDWLEKVTKEPSGMREMFYVLIGGMVTWA